MEKETMNFGCKSNSIFFKLKWLSSCYSCLECEPPTPLCLSSSGPEATALSPCSPPLCSLGPVALCMPLDPISCQHRVSTESLSLVRGK